MTRADPFVQDPCGRPCRAEISGRRVLSLLIREFGGEAICTDLVERMQDLPEFPTVGPGCIVCLRAVLADLHRLDLVMLERVRYDRLLVAITAKGAG